MIKAVVFDLDGVIRIGSAPIPGVNEVFQYLESHDIPYMICTNECRYTPSQIHKMVGEMGISLTTLTDQMIYTAGLATKDYLWIKYQRSIDAQPLQIGIVGESGLESVLRTEWLEVHSTPPSGPKYLIVGTITKIEMHHLEKIRSWIHAGAKVITTCCDLSDLSSRGEYLSGMPNLMIHMACGNVSDAYSTGKPNPIVARGIMKHLEGRVPGIRPADVLFVGDTLYTDIRLAEESGFKSALVLSGNSKRDTLDDYVTSPDRVIDSIRDVPTLLHVDK